MLRAGDLVTVRVGYPGVTAVVPSDLDRSNCASMMIVRQGENFASEWLCYVMNSSIGKANVDLVAYGAAQKQFNISHAVDFVYPVPPKAEQKTIVESLDRHTSKIDDVAISVLNTIGHYVEYRTALISAAVTGKIDVRGEVG